MARVQIYSKENCPYCVRAKNLLDDNNIPYELIDMTNRMDEIPALKERMGMQTFPMILVDGKVIGGYTDLKAIEEAGGLFHLMP